MRIAVGSDIYQSDPELPVSWGRNARELELLVVDGLSPLEAIEAATATGPETLGPQAPRSGQLVEGYDADVLTLARDPIEDVAVLGDPAAITGVWKAGVRVRGGGG